MQDRDSDLKILKGWITYVNQSKPSWDVVRSHSPALKAYYQQWDSLVMKEGILYRELIGVNGVVEHRQLLLPLQLRQELMITVHQGVAGHLGAFKTRAHVVQRVYWFKWRRDVDIYYRRCDTCNEYHKSRTSPKQGRLHPMVLGAPVERWACDLAGPFPRSSRGNIY